MMTLIYAHDACGSKITINIHNKQEIMLLEPGYR